MDQHRNVNEWARAALRALLRRLARQAASELQADALRALAGAQRLKRWRA